MPRRLLLVGWLLGPGLAVPPGFVDRFPQLREPPDYNAVEGPAAPPHRIGNVTGFRPRGRGTFDIACDPDALRVQFYRADVVRVWLGWGGAFSDPASADLVVGSPSPDLEVAASDEGSYYDMRAPGGVSLRAHKRPLRLSMYRRGVELWSEAAGLTGNATASFQTLGAGPDEFFFGGGMQNGRFSHKGHRIRISTSYNWADGGNPNAAPFYVSSAGYGVFRNTWSPGYYDFSDAPVVLAHNESRFDAFYFAAAPLDFKALLEGYTFVTGRPFMPPIYGLGLGDSDCYHNGRHGNDTRVAVAVADEYGRRDMPASWLLVNDGYGCGFGVGPRAFPSDFGVLDGVVASLGGRGLVTGLWSSTGLPNISREVRGSGTRVAKTDVAWVGGGYRFAFDAVRMVAAGIENNSDSRRFIWTVEGWAATHRLAVMWTGDDSGSFDYIRWQIPTYVGSGFSAQAHVSGDIDGIFGGSPETYVRDLQFKCFMTVLMSMSGWAANPDKQPWTWGEPYTSINRMYLKLKGQLTPYLYTLSRVAHDTGVPPVRGMALEFPEDCSTFENHTGSAQQFMSGPSLLVAPVYQPLSETETRGGIYLPAGDWVDFWNGSVTAGPATVDGYPAPLDRLPVFVRAGAIIPMWPAGATYRDGPANPLLLDIYPGGESSFELYEDDGVTRKALEEGAFARTNISCVAPPRALVTGGDTVVTVGASLGAFDGKPGNRSYAFQIHLPKAPKLVLLAQRGGINSSLREHPSRSALDFAESGWFFSSARLRGLLHVKTPALPTGAPFSLDLSAGPRHPRIAMRPCSSAREQLFTFDVPSGTIKHTLGGCLAVGSDLDGSSGTPALELQPCARGPRLGWQLDGATGNLHPPGGGEGKCVDVDRADRMAEIYGCYKPPTSNQRFAFRVNGTNNGRGSGRFASLLDNSCMTVVRPPEVARRRPRASHGPGAPSTAVFV